MGLKWIERDTSKGGRPGCYAYACDQRFIASVYQHQSKWKAFVGDVVGEAPIVDSMIFDHKKEAKEWCAVQLVVMRMNHGS
jgi:hypothetical protein